MVPTAEERYDTIFEAQTRSPSLRRIWAEVYGDDHPGYADPMSFVTLTDLNRIVGDLEVGSGQAFLGGLFYDVRGTYDIALWSNVALLSVVTVLVFLIREQLPTSGQQEPSPT